MSIYEIIGYSLLFIGSLELFLGTVLLRNNPRKNAVQRAVAALSLFSAAFSLTSGTMYVRAALGLSIDLAARINWIGWFTVPAALQILFFLKEDRSRTGNIIGLVLYPLWGLIFILCLFTDLIVAPGYSVIPFINRHGLLEPAGRLFGSLLALWLLYESVRLNKALHGVRKSQFNYFFLGLVIFGGGASFTAGFLQLLGGFKFEPGLAAFFSFPWVALTFYAIIRYSLFDIRLIVSRTLSVIFIFILVFVVHLSAFTLLRPLTGEVSAILIALALIGLIFYGTPLRVKTLELFASLIVKGKYDYQQILRESTNAVVSILDLNELLKYLIGNIQRSLQTENINLLLKGTDNDYHAPHDQSAAPARKLDNELIRWAEQTGQTIVRQELEMARSENEENLWRILAKTNIDLIVPLIYKGKTCGFLTVGQKGNREPYVQSDIDLLEILANHAAIAIENARLYEETRRMNASFQESEAKFRTLADTAAVAIFIHRGGNFLYVNHNAEVVGGYTRDEYLSMNFLSIVHPDFVDLVKARAGDRLAGGGAPLQYEFKINRKNGEHRWVLMTAGITSFEGKPAIIATAIDVTARNQAEEERHQMAALVENSSDFIGMATMDGHVLFINSAGRKLVGLENAEDAKKTRLSDYFFTEDLPALQEQLLPKDFWLGESRIKHFKTNAPIPVEMSGFTVFDEKTGKPTARAAVIRDITDLKQARDQREQYHQALQRVLLSLKESEAKFRSLAETAPAAIFIHRGGKFLYANAASSSMIGYTRDEFLGMDFWGVTHPEDKPMIEARAKARLGGDQAPQRYEFRIVTKKGEVRWVDLTVAVIEYEGKPAVLGTAFDISARKEAEEAKARFYEESVRQYKERMEEEKRHQSEKEKILRDLHDGIGGTTTNIGMLAELAKSSSDIGDIKKTLSTISGLSREGLTEIRNFMYSLDTRDISWQTLTAEIRSQGSSMVEPHGLSFALTSSIEEVVGQPNSFLCLNLFKIYREALTNIIKHAQAKSVTADLLVCRNRLALSLRDDGIGIGGMRAGGRGVSNMKTRAGEIGGSITLTADRGTCITLEIPLPANQAFNHKH